MKRVQGIRRLKRAVILLLSGGLLPLTFFPDWWTSISHYLPFEYIRFVPINIYLGKYTFAAAGFDNLVVVLLVQVFWVVLLLVACKLFWRVAFKKFSGAGA